MIFNPQFPACPHLAADHKTCAHLEGRTEYVLRPSTCLLCQAHGGPYAGRPATSDKFIELVQGQKKMPTAVERPGQIQRARLEWNQGAKSSWEMAEGFLRSARSRGWLATAMGVFGHTAAGTRATDEVVDARRRSCFGGDGFRPCDMLLKNEKGTFCNACGCKDNRVARLDGAEAEGYTKLHFPYLECPLKRQGFSNQAAEPPLTIGIACLNDTEEVNLTIESIRATSPPEVEIIVVDDGSDVPVKLWDSQTRLIRLDDRVGAGKSKHLAGMAGRSKHLLLLDSHMRFVPGWFDEAMKYVPQNPRTLWCAKCLGLNRENMDVNHPVGIYTAARLALYDEPTKHVFEGIWQEARPGDNYEVPCIMGACYFVHKAWFEHLRGMEHNKMWGCEEPFLSVKTWLAGGEVRLLTSVKIGHKFKIGTEGTSYRTGGEYVLYNKLRSMRTTLPPDVADRLQAKLPGNLELIKALQLIKTDAGSITEERAYYLGIFTRDLDWLCDKFQISKP